jgi:hypothetical protein
VPRDRCHECRMRDRAANDAREHFDWPTLIVKLLDLE